MKYFPGSSRLSSPIVKGTISLLLIALVISSIDIAEVRLALSTVSIAAFMILVGIDVLLRLLSAYRWHVLFAALHESTSLVTTTRISLIASFLGQVLPGAVGVEVLRIYGLGKSSDDMPAAFASVVTDRVFGLLSLGLLILAGLVIGPQDLREMVLIPVSVSLLILIVVVFLLMNPHSRSWLVQVMSEKLFGRIRKLLTDIFVCLDRYRSRTGVLVWSLALAVVFQVLRVALFYSAALILGESPSFILFLALVPIVMFATLLPISIGGLGVREAGLVAVFGIFGVMDSALSFTVAILVFLSGLVSLIPGCLLYIGQRKELSN